MTPKRAIIGIVLWGIVVIIGVSMCYASDKPTVPGPSEASLLDTVRTQGAYALSDEDLDKAWMISNAAQALREEIESGEFYSPQQQRKFLQGHLRQEMEYEREFGAKRPYDQHLRDFMEDLVEDEVEAEETEFGQSAKPQPWP